jgi:GGDEF domain-containing protein
MISWVKVCEEIQLVILHADRRRIPITVNASLSANIKVGDSSLTVSIGMSIFDEPISFIDLFTQAGNAVYKEKSRGRNRTEVYLNNS